MALELTLSTVAFGRDIVEILRRGAARVGQFKAAYDAYCAVVSPDKAIMVRAQDLVVIE